MAIEIDGDGCCESNINGNGSCLAGSRVIDSMFSDVQVYEVSDDAGIQIACSYCTVKQEYRGLLGGDTIDRIVFDFDEGIATVYKLPDGDSTNHKDFVPVVEFDMLIALVPKSGDVL